MKARLFSAAALTLLLAACVSLPWVVEQPEKGIADTRDFRYLTLDNGMRVLLISDPDADKGAASLDVKVGSRHDPVGRQGLAHFLEHMLFLGTGKYPDAGEYERFINAHAGGHNAYTSFENTNYFFDVAAEKLEPALDRFSRFFIDPLFDSNYVSREVNAVESEYRARIRNDRRRIYDVLKNEVRTGHPFSNFSVGSLQTLGAGDEAALRAALLDFYGTWYSAHRMALTISGPQSLDILESWVRPRFEPVPVRDTPEDRINTPLTEPGELPMLIQIEPLQNMRELSYSFEIGDQSDHYLTKPAGYIGNLLGHEGEGSLLALLKQQGWAESLSAGTSFAYNGGTLFSVNITLTETGFARRDDITALLFAAIEQIREEGVERWRFQEQGKLGRQQFNYRNVPDAIQDVSDMASRLHDYPPQHVLSGPYIFTKYRPKLIHRALSRMTKDNVHITLVAPEAKTALRSKHYDTPYSVRRSIAIPPPSPEAQRLATQLALPRPNIFIAENLSLRETDTAHSTPVALDNSYGINAWHRVDSSFGVPKGAINILLRAPQKQNDVEFGAQNMLWLRLLEDELNSWEYPANLAGLNVSLEPDRRGVQISIRGYNDKQHRLLQTVLATLREPALDPSRFERIKDELVRGLENSRHVEPYRLLMNDLENLLRRQSWLHERLLPAVNAVELEDLMAHAQRVVNGAGALVQINGNYSTAEAQRITRLIAQELVIDPAVQSSSDDVLVVPRGDRVDIVETEHTDTTVLAYLQADQATKMVRVSVGVLAQMLSSDFYRALRTEKQLGYVVSAYTYPQRDVAGLVLIVQSPVTDVKTLHAEIESFLRDWMSGIDSEAQFERHRTALLSRLRESPTNLWEASDRFWQDLLIGYTDFDSREQLIEALTQLSFDDWREQVRRLLSPTTRRALWLIGSSNVDRRALPGELISDRVAFKKDAQWHRFP